MVYNYKNNLWFTPKAIPEEELEFLDLIEMLALNKVIVERHRIFCQFALGEKYPKVLSIIPSCRN